MNTFYDDVFEYGDEIGLKERECCGGGSASGRSQEQIDIDNKQSSEISANTDTIQKEIDRSTSIDNEQSKELAELSDTVKDMQYYETDNA